jgi:hypothetical protein
LHTTTPIRRSVLIAAACGFAQVGGAASAADLKLMGSVGAESRIFFEHPQYPRQADGPDGSLVLQPEFYAEWADGRDSVLFTPFVRLDNDDPRRSHFDVRDLTWVHAAETWELRAGVRRVFWGVAESNHLADIINQTDLVEDPDTEDKLGQPMVNLALIRPWGTVDLFVLPGFRERTFPGKSGRLRTEPRVDTSSASYESAAEDNHVDYAARYSRSVGPVDVGVYYFWGTGREPRLLPGRTESGEAVLRPRYDLIHQIGLDFLYTTGSCAWKLESIQRYGQGETFSAVVAGFEYTLVGIFGSAIDLGLLGEYHGDDRGYDAPPQVFDHDVFTGIRLGFNDLQDSRLLAGIVADVHGGGRFFNLEASRRLSEHWSLSAKARAFWSAPVSDPLHFIQKDDYLQLTVTRYF